MRLRRNGGSVLAAELKALGGRHWLPDTEVTMADRPYSTRAQKALELSHRTAATLGDDFVGTEHLLIGLLEEETGPAAQILNHLGVTTDRVREVLTVMRPNGDRAVSGRYSRRLRYRCTRRAICGSSLRSQLFGSPAAEQWR